jgi:restriction endonuclease S subunit
MIKIKTIAHIRMGATLRGREATRPVPSGSVHLVRIGDVSQDGTLLNDEFVRIEPNESIKEDMFLRLGDVLFPNRGTRTTALAYRLDLPHTIAGAQFFVLRPDLEQALPEYLAWFLRTEEAARYFEGRRKGTYIQIIQRSDLAEMEIPLPPLDIQQKIVETAKLAVEERILSERLAILKWKLIKGQLSKAVVSTQVHDSATYHPKQLMGIEIERLEVKERSK